ncbi:hypothetical protein BO94DRAFT_537705 [Aspergillus sclerotioniger CBS 115572]|uniref:Mucin-7 n=1 Tax=Aspergillus sclerotioniger CBS 115572 TaxID=1450535 RepID=A0A317VXJ7_9EURO|nr:hypothetical protein BO94DRAFT_537705 [Aspergillus sclerotioniger CBS 115572]PWY78515.1 hypothetical protein BO94DRAFT_537705 [Aspergillus sclerotioniger CBS 115572]
MPSDSFAASVRSAESPLRLNTSIHSSTSSSSESSLPSPSRQDQYPLLTSRYRHLSPKRAAIMNEAGGHPGVRNLLAKFENNQSNTTSPPSRGRSPVGSEHSGSGRPLSKVRASFVAVDGATQPNPLAGLRSVSGRSDSPAAPTRVRSFNSEDFEGGLKSPLSVSPTRNGFPHKIPEQPVATLETPPEDLPEKHDPAPVEPEKPSEVVENPPAPVPIPKATEVSSEVSSPKPTKTVTKRPSTIQVGKPAPKPAARSPAQPRTPTSPAKPEDKTSRTTRAARPATTRTAAAEAPKVATHKPSRTSLNPATKPTTRPVRSSMPARDLTKPTASAASRTTKATPANTTRPSASATTSTSSSTNRKGATTTSTLTRKPSTLKSSTTATQQRAVTPTASTARKQPSRPSPPSGNERPHSRVSNTSSRPLDDSFLARMMRPTASSASKTHDKVEVKSPPRPTKPARAPRRVPSKLDTRTSRVTKLEPGKPLEKRATPEPVKSEEPPVKAMEEAAKETVTEAPVVAEKPVEIAEEPVQPTVETVAEEVAVPATEAVPETKEATEDSAEAAVEQATDLASVPEPEPVAETAEPVEETKESAEPEAPVEAPADVVPEAQSSEVDVDMAALTLN